MENKFPCNCGILFEVLPYEFHPATGGPYRIVWRRLRDSDGGLEYIEIYGQASQMQDAYLLPGDWDMFDSLGNTFRVRVVEPRFKLCTGYRPDNLKYLEQQYEKSNK